MCRITRRLLATDSAEARRALIDRDIQDYGRPGTMNQGGAADTSFSSPEAISEITMISGRTTQILGLSSGSGRVTEGSLMSGRTHQILDLAHPIQDFADLPFPYNGLAMPHAGAAFEIHNYSGAPVDTSSSSSSFLSSSSSSSASNQVPLNEAVINRIKGRINEKELLSVDDTFKVLGEEIDKKYKDITSERKNYMMSALRSGDSQDLADLQYVYSFMRLRHPDQLDVWLSGFITESLTAYDTGDTTSCRKGIRERAISGLRGIGDTKLDELFRQAEGPKALKTFFAGIKLNDAAYIMKTLSEKLKTLGVNAETPPDKTAGTFAFYLRQQVESWGVALTDDIKKQIGFYAESFQDNYEKMIKPNMGFEEKK